MVATSRPDGEGDDIAEYNGARLNVIRLGPGFRPFGSGIRRWDTDSYARNPVSSGGGSASATARRSFGIRSGQREARRSERSEFQRAEHAGRHGNEQYNPKHAGSERVWAERISASWRTQVG